jgi:hypothetical protein
MDRRDLLWRLFGECGQKVFSKIAAGDGRLAAATAPREVSDGMEN